MLDILAITGPIYLTIALGWLATRAGLFERADMRVLGKFVLTLALPALPWRPLGDILAWRYLAVFALGSLETMALGLLWLRRVARQAPVLSVVQAMGMCCPSSGFVGYPLNLLLIPLLLALMAAAGWRPCARGAAWRRGGPGAQPAGAGRGLPDVRHLPDPGAEARPRGPGGGAAGHPGGLVLQHQSGAMVAAITG